MGEDEQPRRTGCPPWRRGRGTARSEGSPRWSGRPGQAVPLEHQRLRHDLGLPRLAPLLLGALGGPHLDGEARQALGDLRLGEIDAWILPRRRRPASAGPPPWPGPRRPGRRTTGRSPGAGRTPDCRDRRSTASGRSRSPGSSPSSPRRRAPRSPAAPASAGRPRAGPPSRPARAPWRRRRARSRRATGRSGSPPNRGRPRRPAAAGRGRPGNRTRAAGSAPRRRAGPPPGCPAAARPPRGRRPARARTSREHARSRRPIRGTSSNRPVSVPTSAKEATVSPSGTFTTRRSIRQPAPPLLLDREKRPDHHQVGAGQARGSAAGSPLPGSRCRGARRYS